VRVSKRDTTRIFAVPCIIRDGKRLMEQLEALLVMGKVGDFDALRPGAAVGHKRPHGWPGLPISYRGLDVQSWCADCLNAHGECPAGFICNSESGTARVAVPMPTELVSKEPVSKEVKTP